MLEFETCARSCGYKTNKDIVIYIKIIRRIFKGFDEK